ncbi:protein SET DOMAIN GROUP 40 isoform X2 [Ziziphus jujuba]|uniref:Protein SET DOMAIN GROUP 40 isoform X2 n=1 Tax=Ziziphus jujuba TaxID=326968 RepID=A0A6P6G2X9_ZIZJJ|nr:protein SET DOMAIN GROUP 40 isoform X2 [Ziziphus jujuba]
MEQEEDNLESLLKWAAEIGVSDSAATSQHGSSNSCLGHSLFVSYFPHAGGRGLGAARDIRKGELVLRVPKSALLTREILLEDEKLSVAVNGHSSLSPVQILAVCLLYEMQKGRSSWWYPYLRNLPHNYDILATFGEFEKQALQVDDAVWAAEKAILKAEVEWKEANVLMKELNLKGRLQTFRAWIWASATVLLCYGTYTNLELLEHYGFFLYENPNDKVFIPLEPEIYSSNSWPKESMFIHQSGKPSFALLSALRLWATQPSQRRSVAHLAYSGCQLSVENEILVMRWISNKCNVLLKSLPTSFEEDSLLLDSIGKVQGLHNSLELRTYLASFTGEISAFVEVNGLRNVEDDSALPLSRKIKRSMERWRLAVQWRLNYKKILVNCISYCAESIDSFNCQKIISGTEHTLI